METMRALVFDRYGPPDVLREAAVPKPEPAAREVRIRVHATTVTAEDPRQRSFSWPWLMRPALAVLMGWPRPRKRILGFEVAGVIDAVGAAVTRFAVGDAVFGYTGLRFGACAEHCCVPQDGVLARKPDVLPFDEAAATPNGALTAYAYLTKLARLRVGERVLVVGASGSVGTAAVQLARHLGAHVTGVCSAKNAGLVRALGADAVIDYRAEDFTARGERWDVVFDTVGATALGATRRVIAPGGRYLLTDFGPAAMLAMLWSRWLGDVRVLGAASNFLWTSEDLARVGALLESGVLRTVIDRRYPLEQAAEAHRYVETGRKVGNVVLTVQAPAR